MIMLIIKTSQTYNITAQTKIFFKGKKKGQLSSLVRPNIFIENFDNRKH